MLYLDTSIQNNTLIRNQIGDPHTLLDTILQDHSLIRNQYNVISDPKYATVRRYSILPTTKLCCN